MRSIGRAFVAPLSLLLIAGFTTVAAAAGGARQGKASVPMRTNCLVSSAAKSVAATDVPSLGTVGAVAGVGRGLDQLFDPRCTRCAGLVGLSRMLLR